MFDKLKKATNYSKEAFNQNKLKREDQISELLLNYCLKVEENDFKSYRKVAGSGYESDIIVDYSPFQISDQLEVNRLKVNEFKEKLEKSPNPILEMKSDVMFTNMSKKAITSVVDEVLKAKYLFENKPHFTLEAKVLKEEKELLNLINNNVVPGSKQLDAYISKHKLDPNNSSNKVFCGINIFYIDLEIIPKDLDQKTQKDLYSLSKTYSLKKKIKGRTIIILAFDKKAPHEYKN